MNPPATFGQWLSQRRLALKLTRAELAQRVGCSVSALRKIEDGERRPSVQIAGLLANGLELPSETHATFVRVARGELGLERLAADVERAPAASPASAAQPAPRINLPLHPTPLIGRRRELAEIDRLLRDPQCRLLTLVGPGGIGKTRLAAEAAVHTAAAFADGAAFVPLASIDSARFMVPAIAEALGFSFYASGPVEPRAQLLSYLQDKQLLLVLDNLEHLLPAAPGGAEQASVDVIADLIQQASGVRLLVTSRETLNFHDEWVFEVTGLPIAGDAAMDAEEAGAVELFLQRARRAHVGFSAAECDFPAIAGICRLMDGMPLGIELAAAWVRTLSCSEILAELERGLDFLALSARDMPARHQSMRTVFEHSWKLLSDDEQRVLCRLAVFQGGFRREAAEKIAAATLALLSALVSKSLLRRAQSGRYDLHEVIRQFSAVRLQAEPEVLEVRDRHADYYLALVRDRETALKNSGLAAALRELTHEIDNVRSACAWAVERTRFEPLGPAVRGLGRLFETSGLLPEGTEQFELIIQALRRVPQDDARRRMLGQALSQQSLLFFRRGDFERAQSLLEESLGWLRPLGEPAPLTDSLVYLGVITHLNGNLERSQTLLEEGLACALAAGDEWLAAYASFNQGYVASLLGQYQSGYEQMQVSIAQWRSIGDPRTIALGLNHLTSTLIQLGRYDEAQANLEESIELCEQARDRWGAGTAYRYLGLTKMAQGKLAEAHMLIRKSLELFSGFTFGWDVARSLVYLGDLALLEDDPVEAQLMFRDALREATIAQAVPLALEALLGLARLEAQAGNPEQARQLAACVVNHSASTDDSRVRARQLASELEAHGIEAASTSAPARPYADLVAEVLASGVNLGMGG